MMQDYCDLDNCYHFANNGLCQNCSTLHPNDFLISKQYAIIPVQDCSKDFSCWKSALQSFYYFYTKLIKKEKPKKLQINSQHFDVTKPGFSNLVFQIESCIDQRLFRNEPGFVILNNHYYVLIGKTYHNYYILQSWCNSYKYHFVKNPTVYFLQEKFAMTNRFYDEIDISGNDVSVEEY
jgi:hypothetical protein